MLLSIIEFHQRIYCTTFRVTITRTNADPVHQCMYAALGGEGGGGVIYVKESAGKNNVKIEIETNNQTLVVLYIW